MKTLPCPICRDHCETYGRENQTNFDTIQRKKGLRIYMIRFQNKINYDQGRRVIPMYMAMKQTRNLWKKKNKPNQTKPNQTKTK